MAWTIKVWGVSCQMAYPNCVIYRACKFFVDTFLLGLQSCSIGCFRLLSTTAACAFSFIQVSHLRTLTKLWQRWKEWLSFLSLGLVTYCCLFLTTIVEHLWSKLLKGLKNLCSSHMLNLCNYRNLSGNSIRGAIPSSLGTIASLEVL